MAGATVSKSLAWGHPPEMEMATYCSSLAWKTPWTEEPGKLESIWSEKSRAGVSDWTTATKAQMNLEIPQSLPVASGLEV